MMRQLGDLLVWCAMIAILVSVVYFTPRLAQYMSADGLSLEDSKAARTLALNADVAAEQSE